MSILWILKTLHVILYEWFNPIGTVNIKIYKKIHFHENHTWSLYWPSQVIFNLKGLSSTLSINWLKEGINCLGASNPIDVSEYTQADLIIYLGPSWSCSSKSLEPNSFNWSERSACASGRSGHSTWQYFSLFLSSEVVAFLPERRQLGFWIFAWAPK